MLFHLEGCDGDGNARLPRHVCSASEAPWIVCVGGDMAENQGYVRGLLGVWCMKFKD